MSFNLGITPLLKTVTIHLRLYLYPNIMVNILPLHGAPKKHQRVPGLTEGGNHYPVGKQLRPIPPGHPVRGHDLEVMFVSFTPPGSCGIQAEIVIIVMLFVNQRLWLKFPSAGWRTLGVTIRYRGGGGWSFCLAIFIYFTREIEICFFTSG